MRAWFAGVLVSVTGTFCSGLGDNLVRKSYSDASLLPADERPPPWKRPLWVTGWMLTTIMDTGCNALALALAPLSLILPLGALHILWGSWFANIINKEPLGHTGVVGAGLIILGVICVLLSAPRSSAHKSFDSTVDDLQSAAFIAGQAAILGLAATCMWLARWSTYAQVKSFAAPAVPGLLGSCSNLMLKVTESIISAEHSHVSSRWEFWVCLLITICLALSQLLSLNHALATGEAFTVIPVANSVLLVGGTVNGLLCFNDAGSRPSPLQASFLALGIAVVVSGIAVLSMRQDGSQLCLPTPVPPSGEDDPSTAAGLLAGGPTRTYNTNTATQDEKCELGYASDPHD